MNQPRPHLPEDEAKVVNMVQKDLVELLAKVYVDGVLNEGKK